LNTAFVTGATGAIGSALVPVLLGRGYRVYLLIRADSLDHLAKRQAELMAFWELPPERDVLA
jgi:nucleoside-diphosphate-sugar epimerase